MIIRENIPLSSLTTMRLGGPARYVIDIESPYDIEPAFNFAQDRNLPFRILGGGANTIAHDEGFAGVIIHSAMSGITDNIRQDPSYIITVLSGTEWDSVVAHACARGLTGIEALSKIPGHAGAAPVQNIGAYGQDIAGTFHSADVYDIKNHRFLTLSAADLHFSYRHSIMNTTHRGHYFVISITLALATGEMPRPFYASLERFIAKHHITDLSPSSIRTAVSSIRADKLPDPALIPSAGSFFKNIYLTEPEATLAEQKGIPVYHGHDGYKINSAWLIEQVGLKGQLLHGFRISYSAPLVLINESATSYADLAAARTEIISAVRKKFNYTLEQEPEEI